jgi:hypothetical protein
MSVSAPFGVMVMPTDLNFRSTNTCSKERGGYGTQCKLKFRDGVVEKQAFQNDGIES